VQHLDALQRVIEEVVAPAAPRIDAEGEYPRAALDALGEAGILGLASSQEVGGLGLGLAEAAAVIEQLAGACGSTAMVMMMHFSAVAMIEAHGPDDVRKEIAAGRHVSTLAFSETGSRSQFWAPLGTATRDGDAIRLDASKSWVTSAGQANSSRTRRA
jgi:alkylation response protein AidB-like acyl-CoA dehydrogenase